ncbi:MAG: GDP-mannose 4,6-dehydratase [Candidatus Omnitrophica bacterium]|nr:GDP-mannose 4,6-dehydratase [Candidatus Omnitrophota bacterium]
MEHKLSLTAKRFLERQRILITGATGFIGTNLSRTFIEEEVLVHLFVRKTSDRVNLQPFADRIHWHEGDLRDPEAIPSVVKQVRPTLVFHLAGSRFNPPTTDALDHGQLNVLGTQRLLEALRETAPEARLVATGSAAEYGSGSGLTEDQLPKPATLLGATKAAATVITQGYARLYGIKAVVLRLFTPFGPFEYAGRLVPSTVLSALRGEEILLGDGRQQRDFLYVEDAVQALILAAMTDLPPGELINVCSGRGTSVLEMAQTILRLMGSSSIARTGALPTRLDELWELSGNGKKAKKLLGWEPSHTLEEGLRKAIQWWKQPKADPQTVRV